MLLMEKNLDYTRIAADLSKTLSETAVERDDKAGAPEEEIVLLRNKGLLPLVIPKEYGGIGANWGEALKVVQQLSSSDGSIGQLYGNHLNLTTLAHVSGTPEQKERYYQETVSNGSFWANAINTRDTRLKITNDGDHFRVNGIKGFGTGVALGDFRVFSALPEGSEEPWIFVIPKDREGVKSNQDWNNFGQRRTDSNSFSFDNVLVRNDEVLGYPNPPTHAFATFLGIIAQLTKTYVYLGIAEGAFESAKEYTKTLTRPWITSGVESATNDPYILHRYGNLWIDLQAAISLADLAGQKVNEAWKKGDLLTFEERGEVAIAVFSAKALATRVGLEITNRIFELMGTRSTTKKYGFDRYWRDLRTFTLHDPVDYKLRDIGNWVLNNQIPLISQYS